MLKLFTNITLYFYIFIYYLVLGFVFELDIIMRYRLRLKCTKIIILNVSYVILWVKLKCVNLLVVFNIKYYAIFDFKFKNLKSWHGIQKLKAGFIHKFKKNLFDYILFISIKQNIEKLL